MVDYKVTVSTAGALHAGTFNNVFMKLVGTDGESDTEKLIEETAFLGGVAVGAVSKFTISCPVSIGELLLIEIQKQSFLWLISDDWFPAKVKVQSPEGKTYTFPIYRWITDSEVHRFREGKALRVFDETHQLCKYDREQELRMREEVYCWDVYAEGIPHTIKADNTSSLPPEVRFSFNKKMEFGFNLLTRVTELKLQGYYYNKKNWDDIDDINHVFWSKRTKISDYVQKHWKEDAFFGYQFLNGVNPILIRRCTALPGNFPVTDEMVSLHGQCSLEDEMKLLKLHTRYTLQINVLARLRLISEGGILSESSACSREGMITILKRSLSTMTYSSLCIPDDIAERGLKAVPNFYYRDDGLRLWAIIHRFVHKVLSYYYKNDADVQRDTELQKWILDIFEHGFLSQAGTGIPEKLSTVYELVKYVTMVIYTCSAQHAAVNAGQYDYGAWMPNTPTTMQLPPTTKGTTMVGTILNISTTVKGLATMWLLSQPSSDFVALGDYPEEHFNEEVPCKAIKDFQHELKVLSAAIRVRNTRLEVPYTYMDPTEMENSVSI